MDVPQKWLVVRIRDLKTGKIKTSLKSLPDLAGFGIRMAARVAPCALDGLCVNIDEMLAKLDTAAGKPFQILDRVNSRLVEVSMEKEGEGYARIL